MKEFYFWISWLYEKTFGFIIKSKCETAKKVEKWCERVWKQYFDKRFGHKILIFWSKTNFIAKELFFSLEKNHKYLDLKLNS